MHRIGTNSGVTLAEQSEGMSEKERGGERERRVVASERVHRAPLGLEQREQEEIHGGVW